MIACHNLTLRVPERAAPLFDAASFEVEGGSCVHIRGGESTGKTVLFELLSVRARVEHASLIVLGRNIARLDVEGLAGLRRRIGACASRPTFLSGRTLAENLMLPFVVRAETSRAATHVGEMVGRVGMEAYSGRAMGSFSWAERCAAGVLRALAGRPELVVLDDVLGHTGPFSRALYEEIGRAREAGSTVVVFGRRAPTSSLYDAYFEIRGGGVKVAARGGER